MKTWECKECGKEVQSKTKPAQACTCGARGKWVKVDSAKLFIVAGMIFLSACSGGGGDAAQPTTLSTPNEVTPVIDPTPSPTPSPSPSASPSPTPYAYGGGSGTQADPYKLDTATDFDHVCDNPAAYYSVTQDINMNGHTVTQCDFSGTIEGGAKQLFNLFVMSSPGTPAALFKAVSGTIKNLTLSGTYTYANVGGSVAGFATVFTGSLLNCRVTGTFNIGASLTPAQAASVVMTTSFGAAGPKLLTGSSFDVMWNGTHYTHSF